MYIILANCKCCFKKSKPYHENPALPELAIQLDDLSASAQELPFIIFLRQEKEQLITQLQDIYSAYSTLPNKGKSNSGSTPPTPQNNLKLENKLTTLNHEFANLEKVHSLISAPNEDYGTQYEELIKILQKIEETIKAKRNKIRILKTKIQAITQNHSLQEEKNLAILVFKNN